MEGTLQNIALKAINDHVGTPPSTKLRKSIRRMGVVQPVLLSEHVEESGEIRYTIVDGNRRIAAARKARLGSVPAMVLKDLDSDQISQLTLILNGYRSANFLTEFWAIRSLNRSRFTFDDIQNLSGYATSSIEHRELLGSLNRELFVALRNGKIIQTFASAIAKLPKSDQDELAEIYLNRGRLLKRDIDEISRRSRILVRSHPPASSMGSDTDQMVSFSPIVTKSESNTYQVNVPGRYVDVPSESIAEAFVPSELAPPSVEQPQAQAAKHETQISIQSEPAASALELAPVEFNGSDLSLNDQRVALHELRSHLISAANIASSFGMDRFGFLAQASRMWDTREQETQSRLIPPNAQIPVTTTPLAASRASAEW